MVAVHRERSELAVAVEVEEDSGTAKGRLVVSPSMTTISRLRSLRAPLLFASADSRRTVFGADPRFLPFPTHRTLTGHASESPATKNRARCDERRTAGHAHFQTL